MQQKMKKLFALLFSIMLGSPQVEAAKKPRSVFDWQIDVIAAALWAEARGEGPLGVRAVAEVIKNRAEKHHAAVYDVVKAPHQFSCFNKGAVAVVTKAKRSTGPDQEMWLFCHTIATGLFNGTFKGLNLVHGATHYCTPGIPPLWARDMECCAVIGNHKFFKSL
jgi:spore germination cell wall hydrolase CwlJ-like protein